MADKKTDSKEAKSTSASLRGSGLLKLRKVVFEKTMGPSHASMTIKEFSSIDCDGASIIEGFPSMTLTSLLTTNYLQEQLELPLIGVITSPEFPPRCVILKGRPTHAVRIFGNKDIVLIISEFKIPKPDLNYWLVQIILDFAKRHNCKMIYTVEGIPTEGLKKRSEVDKEKDLLKFITTSAALSSRLKELNHEAVDEGVIGGVTGLILAEAGLHNQQVSCLLAPTAKHFPDAYPTVSILKTLSKLLDIKIDLGPLEEKALKLQENIEKFMDEAKASGFNAGDKKRVDSMYT